MTITAEIISVLKASPLFQGVPQKLLLDNLDGAQELFLKKGETLLSPQRPNDHVYMVLSGRLNVQIKEAGIEPIALLGEGECAGEMSVLGESQVSAYVIAASDCKLLAVDQGALWSLIDSSPTVAHNMLRILAGRVRSSNQTIASSLETQYGYSGQHMIDELTGLHNRHWMEATFDRLLHRNAENHKACCFILLEIDGFREIVGSYGALGGDQALRTVAQAMLSDLRPDDQAVRYFGPQFAILLPHTETLADACTAAERLLEAVRRAVVVLPSGDALPPVSISLGVSQSRPDDLLDDLLSRTGKALQQAQQAGGNCAKCLK